jgi:hypothetical protein
VTAGGTKRHRLAPYYVLILAAIWLASSIKPSHAVEGAAAAGPIGGSDIRSALLPGPGFYGGAVGLYNVVNGFNDGTGHPAAVLNAVKIKDWIGGPFFLYVPNIDVAGGRIGVAGFWPSGQQCGQLVSAFPRRCSGGAGDPYFEFDWSRSFGQLRPPSVSGAYPIRQGLTLAFGVGALLPVGTYNQQLQKTNAVTLAGDTFDLAPNVAVTYTTLPLIADGTEFSAKLYWNDYATNPATQYHASSLFDVDFAVTEHVGRWQIGPAGDYVFQVGQDKQFGVVIPPDGRRLEYMALGAVANYDIAEYNAAIKVKANETVLAQNGVVAKLIVISFAKKFF